MSLVIVDQLLIIATALNQSSSTVWFNPAATIRVESKKPIGFILPAIYTLFYDTHQIYQAWFFYGHTKLNKTAFLVLYIEVKPYNELEPIST